MSMSNIQQSSMELVISTVNNLLDDQSLINAFGKLSFGHGVAENDTGSPRSLQNDTLLLGSQYDSTLQQQQQIHQPHIGVRNMEDGQYRLMYLQHLQNLRSEVQHSVRADWNGMEMSKNQGQQYLEVPVLQNVEQYNHEEPFWENFAITRESYGSSPAISSVDYNEMLQTLDKRCRQSYLERVLMQSPGLGTLNAMNPWSIVGGESVNHNGMDLRNGNMQHGILSSSWLSLGSGSGNALGSATSLLQRHNTFAFDEVRKRVYLMAKDQNGCRLLQRKFVEGNRRDIEKIFNGIIDHVVELMTDPFGNYLMQKLLEVCDENQRMQLLHQITRKSRDLVRISCDTHGSRAVQKVIETLKTPEQFWVIVSSLKTDIVTLMKDINGNHVAQRCFQYLTPHYIKFLYDAAANNCVELGTDRHGCVVLQKCIDHSDGNQRHRLVREITSNAIVLSQDPFGNYVVQALFDLRLPYATADILKQLKGHYGDLSMQKYSSNVVERCMKEAGEEYLPHVMHELIYNPKLDRILHDPYGNFVIQVALDQSKGVLLAKLVDAIRPHVPSLRCSLYGKNILNSSTLKKQLMGFTHYSTRTLNLRINARGKALRSK